MEEKHNEPTILRPGAGRVIDATLVRIDVPDFINKLKRETAWEKNDRNAITVFKTDGMRIVLIALHKDAVIEKHLANGVISVQVLEGEIIFKTDHESVTLATGQIVALHKDKSHSVEATKEAVILLTLAMGANTGV